MNVLMKTLKTAWGEPAGAEGFGRGGEFEQYIRAALFPRETYDLLYKTHDYSESLEDYVTYTRQPDYKFKSKTLGMEFFIESKFRAKFQDQVPEWCKLFQLKQWQDIDKVIPVLVAVGLGGRPTAPERVFLMPVKHLKFVKLYPGFMQKYEVRPDRPVSENTLKGILE